MKESLGISISFPKYVFSLQAKILCPVDGVFILLV